MPRADQPNPVSRRLAVGSFAAATGMAAVVAQSVLLRELSLLWFGGELSWGITLAGWLVGVAVGAAAGGFAAGKVRPAAVAAIASAGLVASFPLGLWLLRTARGLFSAGIGQFIPLPRMLALTLLSAGAVGFWVGAMFAPGCAMCGGDRRRAIGWFFAVEAAGSLLGGLAYTFLRAYALNPFLLWHFLSLILLLCLFLACRQPEGTPPASVARAGAERYLLLAMMVLLAASANSNLPQSLDDASLQRRWHELVGSMPHVAGGESPFARLDLGSLPGQHTLYVNCQPAGTFPNRIDSAPYVHLAACQAVRLRRALVIGDATGEMAELLRQYPGVGVQAVQQDRQLHELLSANLPAGPPAPTAFADGRQFLRASDGAYDLILLPPGDLTSIAAGRFYTREFFRLARSRLSNGGVLAFALPGPAERVPRPLRDYLGSVYRALEEAFPQTLWSWGDPVWVFAAGETSVLTANPDELRARYEQRGGPDDFDPSLWSGDRLDPPRLAELRAALDASPPGRVNTDDRPLAMFLALKRQEEMLSDGSAGPTSLRQSSLLAALAGIGPTGATAGVIFVCGLAMGGSLLCRARRKPGQLPRLPVLYSLATTGAAGMVLEIVMLAALQNLYGFVYSHVAMIVAVYMAGLAAGGWLLSRRPGGGQVHNSWRKLMLLDAALAAGCAAAPILLGWVGELSGAVGTGGWQYLIEGLLLLLLFAAGLAGGIAVPLSAAAYVPRQEGHSATAPAAGALDAADCLGGSAGALAAGLILLPLLGLTLACLLPAILKASSLAALWVSRPAKAGYEAA